MSMATELSVLDLSVSKVAAADRNPVIVYVGSLAEGSRRTIRGALQLIVDTITQQPGVFPAEDFPWWQLRNHHLLKVRIELAETHAPATVNKALIAARQVFAFCRRFGLMSADECANAGDIKLLKGTRLPTGRALTPEEFQRLLNTISPKTPLGARDRALVCLLVQTGMRRTEVTLLSLQDYDQNTYTLRVLGKGNKQRAVPVSQMLRRELGVWLKIRGDQPGPLFYRGKRPGRIVPDHAMSADGVYRLVRRLARRAGVLQISPHDFRRTFISALLDIPENDLATVSKLVGHASVETTVRYDRRDEKAKRRAVDSLNKFTGEDHDDTYRDAARVR